MGPKKVAAAAPATEKEQKEVPAEPTKAKPKVPKMKPLGNPSTLSMVVEALKNSERKGTSVQAIRTRILATHPSVDPVRLKFHLRSALNKGIEKGILIRPPNSSSTGATGRFKLAKPGAKAKAGGDDKMSENLDPNEQPKEKTKEKAKKKVKKVSKKPKDETGESKDENAEEEAATKVTKKKEKTEAKAASSKPKKDAAEKTTNAPAPAKKPKAKAKPPAAEEGAKPKKEPVKKKAEPLKEDEEKPTAKSGKKGKK